MIEASHRAAPAIVGGVRKSERERELERAIRGTAAVMRTTGHTIALELDGRVRGLLRGACGARRDRVMFAPITHRQWLAMEGYDEINARVKRGYELSATWSKNPGTFAGANRYADYWPVAGVPGAGDYAGTANTFRRLDADSLGALDVRSKRPGAGETRHIYAVYRGALQTTNMGVFMMPYDRAGTYEGVSISTSLANMDNTTKAARHVGSGDEGLQVMITASAALGATASNLSAMAIVDNLGNANNIAAGYTLPWYASAAAGSTTAMAPIVCPHDNVNGYSIAPWIPTPPGIDGVREVTSITSSANNTGTLSVALIRPLMAVWYSYGQIAQLMESPRGGWQMPRIYDDACVNAMHISFHNNGNNAMNSLAQIRMVHG